MQAVILFLELILLYLLSRRLTQAVFVFLLLLTHSRNVAVNATTILLFPGTVIHELSHLFTAEILGVQTGRLELAPEAIRDREDIRTGSVAIAQTGPFRRAVIGLAPLLWGLAAYTMLAYFLQQTCIPFFQQCNNVTIVTIGILYLLFCVSNSMFPSPEDLKGTLSLGIVIGMLLIAAYVAGFRFSLTGQALELTNRIFSSLLQSTTLVLALNGGILLLMQGFIVLVRKITRRKI